MFIESTDFRYAKQINNFFNQKATNCGKSICYAICYMNKNKYRVDFTILKDILSSRVLSDQFSVLDISS